MNPGTFWGIVLMLQWGRNFIVAETANVALSVSPKACFNGAATLSLRKLCMAAWPLIDIKSLQWGRNFIVAET